MNHTQWYHNEIAGAEVSFLVTYTYSPGRPAVMYLSNGDPGYPEDPPEIEVEKIERIYEKDGKPVYEEIPAWLQQIIMDSDYFFERLYENHDEGEPDYD